MTGACPFAPFAATSAGMWGKIFTLAMLGLGLAVDPASAQDAAGNDAFQAYLAQVRTRAIAEGVRPDTATRELAGLTVNPRVIELDRGQPGNPGNTSISPFAPYRIEHVDAQRIGRGRSVYQAQRARLQAIERDTGVPEAIMVAIWGHETNYGSYTGNFDLIRSLASLAYEGRRRSLFEPELIAALKMIDKGVTRAQLKGSWAGATGNPQFLPSIYLRLARDGDGDGRADIWNSRRTRSRPSPIISPMPDGGRASPGASRWACRPLRPQHDRQPAGVAALPRVFQRHSAWHSMAEWRALGLTPMGRAWPADDVQATLIEPDGPGNTAYLLTGNYRVILDYNCSNFYALSVGLLADAVAG